METTAINKFIEIVEDNCHNEDTKKSLIDFATDAIKNESKAEALNQFLENFTNDNGILDSSIFDIESYVINDFYQDYIGNGGELDPSGDGIVGGSDD